MNKEIKQREPTNPKLRVADVIPSCLRLPLMTKWFEITKAGIKKEDYREINPYWYNRLFEGGHRSKLLRQEACYPKSSDSERILKLEHKGIEIRTGNPDWGAIPNKLYFVILHGDVIA